MFQNGDSDSEWARSRGTQNGRGRGNEGRMRRGSLNRSRELHNNQGIPTVEISYFFPFFYEKMSF